MNSGEKKELKKIANNLKPQFNIGKLGITNNFIESIDDYLEAHNIVKIKMMNIESKDKIKEIAKDFANKLDSEIIDEKGFTFVLFRD